MHSVSVACSSSRHEDWRRLAGLAVAGVEGTMMKRAAGSSEPLLCAAFWVGPELWKCDEQALYWKPLDKFLGEGPHWA